MFEPFNILDDNHNMEHAGSKLLAELYSSQRISPLVHIFGHIHQGHGVQKLNDTLFVNAASIMSGSKKSLHAPIVFQLIIQTNKDTHHRTTKLIQLT